MVAAVSSYTVRHIGRSTIQDTTMAQPGDGVYIPQHGEAGAIKLARDTLSRWQDNGCPGCRGDCGSANPPVSCCIMIQTRDALSALSAAANAVADAAEAALSAPDEKDAEIARLREALELARSLCDTPIARRRLGIEANDERIIAIRAALSPPDLGPVPKLPQETRP